MTAAENWSGGHLMQMGWSSGEELLCIQDDGQVLIYDIFGKHQHTFGIGQYEIYNMGWEREVSLESMVVAAAHFGGPIAVTRDRQQFVKVQGLGKPKISIYSASGQIFSSFVEAKEFKVIDAKIFNSDQVTGIAVMTSMYRIYLVNNVKEPRVRHLAEVPSLNKLPNCWTVVSEDRQTKVLLAEGKQVHSLMSGQRSLQVATDFDGKIVDIAVSFNNRHVALLSENGTLWVGSADIRNKYVEIFKNFPVQLKQFV
ncbi:hypothetical protein J437_LFUL014231, partial [Ladona fulva]